MQSQSTQLRGEENYKIMSKGLQRKAALMLEDSRVWMRLVFLDLKLQGLVSVKPVGQEPHCWQQSLALPWGVTAGST